MTILLLLLVLSALSALMALLAREIRLDGYGRRPGPPSHL